MNMEWLMPLLKGLIVTLQFFSLTLVISIPLGLLIAVAANYLPKPIKIIIQGYVYLFRGTPLLLQMMFVFFGLPLVGIVLGRFESAILTLCLNYAAYFVEIFRGGIQSINKGQFEAIKVLAISEFDGWRKVILPQVWRIVMPSVGNEVITLIKDTSLVYILGLEELLKVGKSLSNQQASLLPFVYVAIIYLAITAVTTLALNQIEKRLGGK